MTEYHTIYKDIPGQTTEWDDLQVKYGNREAKPKPKSVPFVPKEENTAKDKEWLDSKAPEELEEMEDDFDDDRFMEEYRRKRMAELQVQAARPRFGSVRQIGGADFVAEVSRASESVWVVVHLFKDSVPGCQLLNACLEELAPKYAGTKFVKMISTECIKDYPDFNLPTLLVYSNADVKATLIGLQKLGGRGCTPESVAYGLLQVGPVLSDGSGESQGSAVMERVQKEFVERLVAKREDEEEDSD